MGESARADAVPALGSLILAGGLSLRMGRDKAGLLYHGEPQVRRIARLLERVAPPAYVAARPAQLVDEAFAGLRLLPDREEGIGPLEGILSAFREDPARAWLIVAVDMPFLTEHALRFLVDSRDARGFATAFRNLEIDGPEPVCAIYEPRMRPVLEDRKKNGRYSLQVLRDLPVRLVDPPSAEELQNINYPEEYRQAVDPGAGGDQPAGT